MSVCKVRLDAWSLLGIGNGETPIVFEFCSQSEAQFQEYLMIMEGKALANFRILPGSQPTREDTQFGLPWGHFLEPVEHFGVGWAGGHLHLHMEGGHLHI